MHALLAGRGGRDIINVYSVDEVESHSILVDGRAIGERLFFKVTGVDPLRRMMTGWTAYLYTDDGNRIPSIFN